MRYFFLIMLSMFSIMSLASMSAKPEPHMVYVYDGDHHFVAIYADHSASIPMANPFLSNADGSYRFTTKTQDVVVEVK